MNKQTAKNYVIGSVVATMFIGLGFGIVIASPYISVIYFGGLVLSIVSLIMTFILLRKVKKPGYKIKMIKEGEEDEQKT